MDYDSLPLRCCSRLLMVISLVAATSAQGDDIAQDLTFPTSSPTFSVNDVVDAATQLDPNGGSAVGTAIANGSVNVVEFNAPGNYGYHDWNTIALNPAYGVNVMAIALLHEWNHVTNCTPPGSGGSGHDDRSPGGPAHTSCWPCTHAQMIADDWTYLTEFVCISGITASFPVDPCELLDDLQSLAQAEHTACGSAQPPCTGIPNFDDLADWDMICPACGG